jgi:hypothetical protein
MHRNDLNVKLLKRNIEMGLTAGVTNQQVMRTSPRHLIPSMVYPEVCVCPFLKFVFSTGLMRLMTVCDLCNFMFITDNFLVGFV